MSSRFSGGLLTVEQTVISVASAIPTGVNALGTTASYLLAHRPCRVVIETPAADGSARPGAGADRGAVRVLRQS